MVSGFQKLRPAIDETLKNLWQDVGVELTNQDWTTIEKISRVLKPLEEATKLLSKFDASISMVIPFVTTILKSLEDQSEDRGVLTWKRALKKNLEERFSTIESNFHYTAATMLDSRYKHHFYRNPDTAKDTKDYITEKIYQSLTGQQVFGQHLTLF